MHAAAVIDVERYLRIEVSERIVRQSGEMDHRLDALQVALREVAHILHQGWHRHDGAAGFECAALIKVAVAADHLVTGLEQHRHHDRADVAAMPSDQNSHLSAPISIGGSATASTRSSLWRIGECFRRPQKPS